MTREREPERQGPWALGFLELNYEQNFAALCGVQPIIAVIIALFSG